MPVYLFLIRWLLLYLKVEKENIWIWWGFKYKYSDISNIEESW